MDLKTLIEQSTKYTLQTDSLYIRGWRNGNGNGNVVWGCSINPLGICAEYIGNGLTMDEAFDEAWRSLPGTGCQSHDL